MKHQLTNLKILTVGLVKRGANMKEFFLLKSEDADSQQLEEFAREVNMPANEGDTAVLDQVGEIFKDDPTPLGKFKEWLAALGKGADEGDGTDPDPKTETDPEPEPQVVAVEVLQSQIEAFQKSQEALQERLEKAEKEAATEREARERQEYIEKAKSFASLPAKPQELGEYLMFVAKSDEKRYEWVEAFLKAVDAQLAEAGIYQEFGTSKEGEEETLLEKAKKLAAEGENVSIKDALLQLKGSEAEEYVYSFGRKE